jgi:hypothetical protein
MTDPNTVTYYAHKDAGEKNGAPYCYYFHASPSKWWVEIHGLKEPIVKVSVRERRPTDPPSDYWGWLPTKDPDHFIFVWPSEMQLNMCFPYGPKADEDRGYGRKVNLVVEEIP